MSFDEEWANLKAEALARQSAGMQLNQLPADAGGSPGGVSADGTLDYNSASINGNANLLIEIAGFLHEGRPDGDLCTLARDPRSHSDVAAQVEIFIASGYLAQLKAESEFADVPPDEMTPAQYEELAARYNGGPYWEGDQAQAYGRGFGNHLENARDALR
ncbi:hypothetical protein [Streptomyces rubiginosohelvolus]|uniref:hypothetical protein n=1 Tax=Streptomyces rubiginosohelvolus TaxID=67362 RepID=UPI0035D98031